MNAKKRQTKMRLSLLFYFLLICLVAVFSKLVKVQAMDAKKYEEMAVGQRITDHELTPDRGSIYDRNGEILALSTDMDTVFVTPYQIKKKWKSAKKIAAILGESTDTIFEKLDSDNGFAYLARKIDKEKADKLKELNIEGLGFVKESKRQYPLGRLASHIIGFVGLDNIGLSGLEIQYDNKLKGKPGKVITEQDINGYPIPGGKNTFIPSTNGSQLILTIDKEIQYKAELELSAAIEKYEAKGGNIIVMDPKSGEIYAMASLPDFDLNDFSNSESENFRNTAVTDVYEPGSTMKIITATAILEEKLFSPDSKFMLPGSIKIGGWLIKEAHGRGTEEFTLSSIVTRSSNVGATHIGKVLGKERMIKYIKRFGLNSPTNIDLPGESIGSLLSADLWSKSTIATVSFGQGTSVTSIEMIRAFSVIANHGVAVRPHLVDQIVSTRGKRTSLASEDSNVQVVSPRTASLMTEIMEDAVGTGTGKNAQIEGYSVAGKTGTAQKPNTDKPGYSGYIGSFIGYAPAKDPAIAILVTIDEPKGAIYGGVVAAPVFSSVGEFALQRLKVTPDQVDKGDKQQ